MVKVACIQLNCTLDIDDNYRRSEKLITEAAIKGCELVVTPEFTFRMTPAGVKIPIEEQYLDDDNYILAQYKMLASRLNLWIVLGSIQVKLTNSEKIMNRSYVIKPSSEKDCIGSVVATYDKIHLYDAKLKIEQQEVNIRETETTNAGIYGVVTHLPWCILGLSICNDIRFPGYYRKLAATGANVIVIPTATLPITAKYQWHVLVRARAIETSCYIIAPAQCGSHGNGKNSFGHSLIVSPKGEILAEASSENEEFIYANINIDYVEAERKVIYSNSLEDRIYQVNTIHN